MALFAIADPHLSLGSDKPMHVFAGWGGYVERLEQNWRQLVAPGDTVVIPGGISWGMSLEESLTDFRFLDSLPGRKVLMKGNHDYWWTTRSKMEAFFAGNRLDSLKILHNNCVAYENYGICGTRGWIFEKGEPQDVKVLAREAGRLEASIQDALKKGLEPLVFLHYPPVFGEEISQPILNLLMKYEIRRCYYGHLHGPAIYHAVRGSWFGLEFYLISADSLNFTPFQIL